MNDCIFCKIIKQEIEASFVYEDEFSVAFLDIAPINEGHVLVVPKQHSERFTQLSLETAAHLFKVGHMVLKAIEESEIKSEGANLFLSDGAVAGQEVMHSHLHITPRFSGDRHRLGFFSHANEVKVSRDQLNKIALKISSELKVLKV